MTEKPSIYFCITGYVLPGTYNQDTNNLSQTIEGRAKGFYSDEEILLMKIVKFVFQNPIIFIAVIILLIIYFA